MSTLVVPILSFMISGAMYYGEVHLSNEYDSLDTAAILFLEIPKPPTLIILKSLDKVSIKMFGGVMFLCIILWRWR